MGKREVTSGLLLVSSLIVVLLIPCMTNGQVTSYYETTRDYNQVAFTLTTFLPVEQETYSKSLQLQFQLIWNISLESLLPTHQVIKGCAYNIDDNRLVGIVPNGSLAIPRKESYWYSYSVDISNLTQGNHEISIIAFQYYGNSSFQGLFNQSSTPITFEVDNTLPPTTTAPTPRPTANETLFLPPRNPPHLDPTFYLIPVSVIVTAAILAVLLFRRHQKTVNLKQ